MANGVFQSGGFGNAIGGFAEGFFRERNRREQLEEQKKLNRQKAKLVERRRVSSSYPVLTLTTRGGATPHTAKQEVKLSLPQQESVRWDIQRTLPIGRWSILYTDAEAGDSVQLLVGRVRAN